MRSMDRKWHSMGRIPKKEQMIDKYKKAIEDNSENKHERTEYNTRMVAEA